MDDVTPNCLEEKIDHLWLNILQFYFSLSSGFGCEREATIATRAKIRANVTVSLVRNRKKAKVVFVENKRPSKAKNGPQRPAWTRAADQLLNYMLQQRNAHLQLTQDLWGIVCIGYYTKFFVLRHGQQTLQPYNGDVRWESNVHFNDIATILSNIQREIRVQSRSAQ